MAQDAPYTFASLYLEGTNGLEGPYSIEELRNRILSGEIPLSSRLFDADQNHWYSAHDIFAAPEESAPESSKTPSVKEFQAPPRPKEFKRSAPLTQNSTQKNIAEANKPLLVAKNARPTLIERTREILRHKENQFPMKVVGVLTVTVIGSFVLWSLSQSDKAREPAATQKTRNQNFAAPSTPSVPMPVGTNQALGTGNNPVNRHLGGQTSEAHNKAMELLKQPEAPSASDTAQALVPPQPAESPAQTETVQHFDPAAIDPTNAPLTPPDPSVMNPNPAAVATGNQAPDANNPQTTDQSQAPVDPSSGDAHTSNVVAPTMQPLQPIDPNTAPGTPATDPYRVPSGDSQAAPEVPPAPAEQQQ